MNFYGFLYDSKIARLVSRILYPLLFGIVSFCITGFTVIWLIQNGAFDELSAQTIVNVETAIFILCVILNIVIFSLDVFRKRGVYVEEDGLRLVTSLYSSNMKPSIKILYSNIEDAFVNHQSLWKTKNAGHIIDIWVSRKEYIELTLENGRKKYISVENADKCCADILAKINAQEQIVQKGNNRGAILNETSDFVANEKISRSSAKREKITVVIKSILIPQIGFVLLTVINKNYIMKTPNPYLFVLGLFFVALIASAVRIYRYFRK